MDFINYELSRKIDEIRRKEREERIKNGQICGTCKHWKLRMPEIFQPSGYKDFLLQMSVCRMLLRKQ